MAQTKLPIQITEKTVIKKYREGADPNTDQPYEIVEGPDIVYKGQAAVTRLLELGYDIPKSIDKEGMIHAIN